MDMIGMLWQLGILSAVLVFGIKVGLASGLANLSKKWLLAICIGYGGGVLGLASIASLYSKELTEIIYGYNVLFFLIMSIIMILAGIFTIREWKVHNKNTSTATCLAVVAPCPCCFGSIIVSILLVSPIIGLGPFNLSKYVAFALVVTIIVSYFTSNLITKLTSKPYPIVLGNFMLFLGIYFLLSAIVIPNIAGAMGKSMSSIKVGDPTSIAISIIFVIILLVVGILISKKSDGLLK